MSHFEIVHTDVGYHARLEGDNHEAVWTTEVYTSHHAALDAIAFICTALVSDRSVTLDMTLSGGGAVTMHLDAHPLGEKLSIPISWVDQRGKNDVAYGGDQS